MYHASSGSLYAQTQKSLIASKFSLQSSRDICRNVLVYVQKFNVLLTKWPLFPSLLLLHVFLLSTVKLVRHLSVFCLTPSTNAPIAFT